MTSRSMIVLLSLFAAIAPGAAQTTTAGEYQVKAAFLYNFAKFIEWPAKALKPNPDRFQFCVLGEDPFGGALQATLDGKTIRERPGAVAHFFDVKSADGCQIVFIAKSEKKNLRSLLNALHARGILTVGETEGFAADGGIIGFRLEDGKVRLEINLPAAEEAHLQISSKLLSLAQIVKKP